ncbi:MAG: Do family serine endopeptidase [Bacteroidetes bacterium]|nr:Do family serine endopeptidase [Bacteroidota bacterium]MCB0854288.1 Do family serine endopeptidase [Bacteroidota bacterium]
MKKFAFIVLSAMLGSAFTLGAFKIFDKKQENVYRIEHSTSLPSVPTKYDKDGNLAVMDFTYPAEKVMPAVVHIKSTITSSKRDRNNQYVLPDPFREFFGDQFGERYNRNQPKVGTGSGVIIKESGFIVTNNHVIEDADDIEVSLYDNRTFKAKLLGTDPSTDLALLKIEADNLPSIQMANSDNAKVGQWVLAIGNPYNLNSTVTAGIISAKGRNINILRDRSAIESFIQTDAAVNPGNSGGALVNLDGDLIGINTAIASPTGSYSGYSFAVPTNIVAKVVEDLLKYGTIQRGFLGVMIRNVDGNLAREKSLSLNDGVYVDSLVEEGSALASGIKKGDVIVGVNNTPVKTSSELQVAIGTLRPGDKVDITVNREGSEKTIPVVLRNQNGNTELVEKTEVNTLSSALGAEFENLSSEELKKLGLDSGVRVKSLTRGKISSQTEMQEGFIITKVDGQKVKSVDNLMRVLEAKEGGVLLEGVYAGYPGKQYYALGL